MTTLDERPLVEPEGPDSPRSRAALLIPALLLLLLVGAAGVVLGQRTASDRTLTDPVSIGFARDMQIHHAQAVAMSAPIHRRVQDTELNYLAFDIMTTQQAQIGIMDGWLDLADPDAARDEPMAWMEDHEMGPDGRMPGMATDAQVAALDELPLPEATEQYLRLMVRHHAGALPMAQYAAENAEHPSVQQLAQSMYDAQAAEIGQLQRMLQERGLPVEPVDAPVTAPAPGTGAETGSGPSEHAGGHR